MFGYIWIMIENFVEKLYFDLGITHEWCRHYMVVDSPEAFISLAGFELYCWLAIAILVAIGYAAYATRDIHVIEEVKSLLKKS